MSPNFLQPIQRKLLALEAAQQQVQTWQAAGERVVFTNGCFDLLHYGHIHYLAEAAALGDRLIVGLNSDASVRRLKGAHRPIQAEHSRAHVLAALQPVDVVLLFEDDTPLQLITALQPDVLVKGGDWEIHAIVGSDLVLAKGGAVHSLEFVEGYSTTTIEQSILHAEPPSKQQ